MIIDMRYTYIHGENIHKSFLSAEPHSGSFTPGDYTSDYLGFFGFGSGDVHNAPIGNELSAFTFYSIHTVEKDPLYNAFMLYRLFKNNDINLNPIEFMFYVKSLMRFLEIPETFNSSIFTSDVGNKTVECCTLIYSKGSEVHIDFGIKNVHELKFAIPFKPYNIPYTFYDHYTQLGGKRHSISIMNAMRRVKFANNWERVDHQLKTMIDVVNKVIR